MVRFILALAIAGVVHAEASAQLFPNAPWNRGRVQSNCPGGVCPTGNVTRASQLGPVVQRERGHWSYPGTIQGHLQGTHGVSTAGMSREQMLSLHDALHEGRQVTAAPVDPVKAPVLLAPVPAFTGGSIQQSIVEPQTSNDPTFGLGAMLEPRMVELPKHVLGQIKPEAAEEVKPVDADTSFRRELAKAIQAARKSGKIDGKTAVRLRAAILSPAFQEAAREMAVTQMAFSGEVSEHVPFDEEGAIEAEGIDWEGLARFLEAFIPLLLQLLNAFGR